MAMNQPTAHAVVLRLRTRPQFQAAMAAPVVARTAHFVLHRAPLDVVPDAAPAPEGPRADRPRALFGVQGVWMGALVPKRWARHAVTRNTIKRQVRAVAAQAAARLPAAVFLVRLRTGFDRRTYPSATSEPLRRAVRGELLQLFERATRPARDAGAAPVREAAA